MKSIGGIGVQQDSAEESDPLPRPQEFQFSEGKSLSLTFSPSAQQGLCLRTLLAAGEVAGVSSLGSVEQSVSKLEAAFKWLEKMQVESTETSSEIGRVLDLNTAVLPGESTSALSATRFIKPDAERSSQDLDELQKSFDADTSGVCSLADLWTALPADPISSVTNGNSIGGSRDDEAAVTSNFTCDLGIAAASGNGLSLSEIVAQQALELEFSSSA